MEEFTGKKVLIRACFNVLNNEGTIDDYTRLERAMPLIEELQKHVGKIVLVAHAGRPQGKEDENLSLAPVASYLSQELGTAVELLPANIDEALEQFSESPEQIFILENIRFFPEEESESEEIRTKFAIQLAKFGDVFINDSFPDYRVAASTYEIATQLPSSIGPAFQIELNNMKRLTESPAKPFVAVLGGAKLSEKLDALKAILPLVDTVAIGGAMAYTLLKAKGVEIGKSLWEEDKLDVATEILELAGDKLLLPQDHLVASEFAERSDRNPYEITESVVIPADKLAVDIGPKTIDAIAHVVFSAQTILWNGPMGVFEWIEASQGTQKVAKAIANSEGFSLIGGGDSVSAISKYEITGFDYISAGGGAMLAYLAEEKFPTLAIIEQSQL